MLMYHQRTIDAVIQDFDSERGGFFRNMSEEIDIPEKIKKWNWGAFLLFPFWLAHYRVWKGIFLFIIPLFGPIIVPFWIGANGNQIAWKKSRYQSVDLFLKRQKYWSIAGFVFWIVVLLGLPTYLFYSLKYSEGVKMGIKIANSNNRIRTHFDGPLKKNLLSIDYYEYQPPIYKVTLKTTETEKRESIKFEWERRDRDWITKNIIISDANGGSQPIVSNPMIHDSFSDVKPFDKTTLENALNRVAFAGDGYVILNRSMELNDFIQTAARLLDDGTVAFSIMYSHRYSEKNKQLFQSKSLFSKEEVIKIFTQYASGNDSHINAIEWEQLISIESIGQDAAFFHFGKKCHTVTPKRPSSEAKDSPLNLRRHRCRSYQMQKRIISDFLRQTEK